MSVKRQINILGQQRLDVPMLRSIDSSVAADFDVLAGSMLAGGQALVLAGIVPVLSPSPIGAAASAISIDVSGGLLMHPLAAEAGTIYEFDQTAPNEVLATTNSKVQGSFTPSATNYVGMDLSRAASDLTADLGFFLDPVTKVEVPRTVPMARLLEPVFIISTTPFESTPNIAPLFTVVTSANNGVVSIDDSRAMLFRLATGGSQPDNESAYLWPNGRTIENSTPPPADPFAIGDKSLNSLKTWADAVMTRLWEIGGGERWFSGTAERDVKIVFSDDVLPVHGTNAYWTVGTSTLEWQGLSVVFANSTGWFNNIAPGTITLADGECLYVDIDRSQNIITPALVLERSEVELVGTPVIPGSRFVIFWRSGTQVYARDYPFEVNRTFGLPAPTGNDQAVLFEGPAIPNWRMITEDDIVQLLTITSFTTPATLFEKGVAVNTPSFSATYVNQGGVPTTAILSDSDSNTQGLTPPATAFASAYNFSKTPVGSNGLVTFTLTADAGNTPSVATRAVSWGRFFYAGVNAAASPALNPAFVTGLLNSDSSANKALATTKTRRIQMLGAAAPATEYVFFAYPNYFGATVAVFDNISGFVVTSAFVDMGTVASVDVENAGGPVLETYRVWRSLVPQAGDIDITVS